MGFGLISKEKHIVLCTLLMIISIAFCSGCDPQYGSYPSSKASKWICSDPKLTIVYTKQGNGSIISDATLEWEGTIIEVRVMFQSCLYDVFPKNSKEYDDRLFGGHWEYNDSDLILNIEDDYIFGRQYNKLILSPSELG